MRLFGFKLERDTELVAEKDARKRQSRIRNLWDDLEDAEERLSKWGFGMVPSERRRMKERIERLRNALIDLNITEDEADQHGVNRYRL